MLHRFTRRKSGRRQLSPLVLSGVVLLAIAFAAPSSAFGYAGTRPVGSPALSDASAASRVVRTGWERIPRNYTANHRVPTAAELSRYRAAHWGPCASTHWTKVTGNFTGTTDDI